MGGENVDFGPAGVWCQYGGEAPIFVTWAQNYEGLTSQTRRALFFNIKIINIELALWWVASGAMSSQVMLSRHEFSLSVRPKRVTLRKAEPDLLFLYQSGREMRNATELRKPSKENTGQQGVRR